MKSDAPPNNKQPTEEQLMSDHHGKKIERVLRATCNPDVRYRSARETAADLATIHREFAVFLELRKADPPAGFQFDAPRDVQEAQVRYKTLLDDCLAYHGWTYATWQVVMEISKQVDSLHAVFGMGL